MRAYLYFTWEDLDDPSGFAMLKQAMLHEVSDHILQLGQKGFIFLTTKSYRQVDKAIKEKRGRPFLLVDITNGLASDKLKTNINLDDLKQRFKGHDKAPLSVDGVLDKILNRGWSALTQEERDYLHAKSME